MSELKEKLNKFIQDTVKLKNFEYNLIEGFKITEASKGSITVEYEVKRNECNHRHTFHGGAASAFSDIIFYITWASTLETNEKVTNLPFTVSLNLIYISAIRLGETMIIKSKIEKKSKNLIFLKLKMIHSKDNRLINTATAIFKTFPPSKL